MGITGVAMPLLSTLAALVIIVHSAEEEASRGLDYDPRFDMATEMMTTGAHDRRWRVSRQGEWTPSTELMAQQSTPMDSWTEKPRPPRRRRPTRRRKRLPTTIPVERIQFEEYQQDPTTQEKLTFVKYFEDLDEHHQHRYTNNKRTKRRRLKSTTTPPETTKSKTWTANRPHLAEFDEFFSDDVSDASAHKNHMTESGPYDLNAKQSDNDENRFKFVEDGNKTSDRNTSKSIQTHKHNKDTQYQTNVRLDRDLNEATRIQRANYRPNIETNTHYMDKQDKSLSEFSPEFMNSDVYPKDTIFKDDDDEEAEQNGDRMESPIDPMSLKDILKQSNGTSLSEILYEHNLTLSDLLRGKADAISVLKTKELFEENDKFGIIENKDEKEVSEHDEYGGIVEKNDTKEVSEKQDHKFVDILNMDEPKELKDEGHDDKFRDVVNMGENYDKKAQKTFQINNQVKIIYDLNEQPQENFGKEAGLEIHINNRQRKRQENPTIEEKENIPNIFETAPKRRFPRRKLRLRTAAVNGTYKSPLNRDLMANTARKYYNNRNMTKPRDWKYVIPHIISSGSSEEPNRKNEATETPTTTTSAPEETTILINSDYYSPSTLAIVIEDIETTTDKSDYEEENAEIETTTAIFTTEEITTLETITTTEKPKVSRLRPPANRMGLRRQAYNNRMKRKRMKQKISTTEFPAESFFGIPNLVSSSEFIAQTQTPKNQNTDIEEHYFTSLDDFFTTAKPKQPDSEYRYTRNSTSSAKEIEPTRAPTPLQFLSTTEETAKFEIEEILNDTRSSARLSKILMERNMTLNELVEHRERGSSHVHLADIFHNASKEPNPPEPFLTKSSIEPISKETYPLRAILEANLHDAAPKGKIDPGVDQPHSVAIPIAMDFGNNVNENGENMGVLSLFTKLAESDISSVENTSTGHDSDGTPYITTIFAVNNTAIPDTKRESKALKREENNLKNDVLGWGHLFEIMRRNQKNESHENELLKVLEAKDQTVEDSDGDGVIAFEDLQRLKDFNINFREAKIDIPQREETTLLGVRDTNSRTKSVTVAIASIVGLAMILLLLSYVAFKWKQQRCMLRKKQNLCDERIPTPVYENKKGHKSNCSMRSISPMLNSSNIYSSNTFDSSINGNESPDYMWDSLRKPFQ